MLSKEKMLKENNLAVCAAEIGMECCLGFYIQQRSFCDLDL